MRMRTMPELEIGMAILFFMVIGGFATIVLQQLPRLWKWFRFKVWHDLRYAEGDRKGLADGQRIEQRWHDES